MSVNADDAEIIRNGRTDEIGSICFVPKIRLVGGDETFDEAPALDSALSNNLKPSAFEGPVHPGRRVTLIAEREPETTVQRLSPPRLNF
ncbi:hypothetical protein MY5147_003047 [Beauveria neobassiana]